MVLQLLATTLALLTSILATSPGVVMSIAPPPVVAEGACDVEALDC